LQCIIDLIDREELILRITLFGMASPASVHYRHMMPCGIQVIMSTGKLSLPESSCIINSGDRQVPETGIITVKSGDRQVPKTGIVIVHSPSSPETGKLSLPETGTVNVAQSFIHRQVKSSCG
jgi:hypothetical protein